MAKGHALNFAEPLIARHYGKAAFDAVGPLLLIGWSEVGPVPLQAISTTSVVAVGEQLSQIAQWTVSAVASLSQAEQLVGRDERVRQIWITLSIVGFGRRCVLLCNLCGFPH